MSAVAVAAVWFLGARNLQAQAIQAACSGEPARFHPCALVRAKTFNPQRTPDGKPDLQGYCRGLPSGTENIEEHPKTDDDDGGRSLIVEPADGRVPYQAWAAALPGQHRTQYVEPNVPCFPSGVPRSLYVPTQIEFLQTSGYVLILFERAHTYRIIPTDARPHIGPDIQLWQGDSRAGIGTAIRSSSTSRITTPSPGSIRRETSIRTRRTWSSASP